MYELIILSLLAQWPLHGYLIAKIANDMTGPYTRISGGRLYPLLAKLEATGLIAISPAPEPGPGGRRQRRYSITDEGRLRFHELMLDTTSNPGDYQRLFWYKVPPLYLLPLAERLYLLDHYMTYCQTHIFHFMNEIADMRTAHENFQRAPAVAKESVLFVMEHVLAHWRRELESAQAWRARILADAEGVESSAPDPAAISPGDTGQTNHGGETPT
ncbi:MAG: PadR family transcriptional regulator [Ktedonobacterales bacterium]